MLSVTGANRGVGLALVQDLLEHKPSAVVFAGVRKIDNLKAGDKLKDLADKQGNRLNLVQLSSTSVEDAREVGKVILDKAGKLDVVIANAGENSEPFR
jgi:NAD(P)-dependent dehydrogenase (short-subunit alcohol dehydrogenase family)